MKRTNLINGLGLDHFYAAFSEEEIQDLKMLVRFSKKCRHSRVISGKNAWEGVYLYSNTGSYFEMIQDPLKYGSGIALSPYAIQYLDVSKVVKTLSKYHWTSRTRLCLPAPDIVRPL